MKRLLILCAILSSCGETRPHPGWFDQDAYVRLHIIDAEGQARVIHVSKDSLRWAIEAAGDEP